MVKRRIGGSRAPLLVLTACIIGAAFFAAAASSTSAAAAKGGKKLVLYSVATQEQFLNHEDDRTRGKGNNPFGNFKDSTSATKESGTGPFAGDRAVFTFKVFDSADLKNAVGSATFICQYGFNKNAFCNASYQLSGGQMIGEGAFNFNAPKFELAIVGGTGKYRGLTGDLQASAAVKHAQRLEFVLA